MTLTPQQRELLGLPEHLVETVSTVPVDCCTTCRQPACVCGSGPDAFYEEAGTPEEKQAKDTEARMRKANAQVVKDLRRGLNTKDDTVTMHPSTDFVR